jgi:hypothetical protein
VAVKPALSHIDNRPRAHVRLSSGYHTNQFSDVLRIIEMDNQSRVKFRGGALIGWFSASWPFATLTAEKGMLTLRCLFTLKFSAAQIVRLEAVNIIPVIASGIRIVHSDPVAPQRIVFWCIGQRDRKMAAIAAELGSGDGTPVELAPANPKLRRWAAVGVVAFFGLIVGLLALTARYSVAYDLAVQAMYASPEVERSLGTGKTAVLIGSKWMGSGRSRCQEFRFLVHGDKGTGVVRVRTGTLGGIDWREPQVVEGSYQHFPGGCYDGPIVKSTTAGKLSSPAG